MHYKFGAFFMLCIVQLTVTEEDAGKCIELQCAIKVYKMIFLGVLISQNTMNTLPFQQQQGYLHTVVR